jgi:multisubunit Na+/H+ antiporter MnhE subunit
MPLRSRIVPLARSVAAWWLVWAFAAALYLLLIDVTDLPELIVGGVAAAVAATGSELARHQRVMGEPIRLRWLRGLYRPLLKVPVDIGLVSFAALAALVGRRSPGQFRAVSFRPGADEQRESSRHALTEALGSFAPNTIVVGIDPDRQLLLVHQLHRSGGREALDLLELG